MLSMAVMGLRRRRLLIWLMAALLFVLGYLLLTFDMQMSAAHKAVWRTHSATAEHPIRPPTSLEAFQRRRNRLQAACMARSADQRRPPFRYHTLRVKSMSFCSLAKTGTTFWKRILYYLDRGLSGPFLSHDFGAIHAKTLHLLDRRRVSTAQSYKSIVFVREPYTRLFSAYVDKLFTPRAKNWLRYARPAMLYSRPGATRLERACCHNVTFAEFVRYYIDLELNKLGNSSVNKRRDEHFVPISQQCNFCGTPYDFIGHQETFAEDTLGILAQLNLSAMLTFSDLDKGYKRYEMDALIRYTFENEIVQVADERGCMSREEVLRRLWKAFQIRGTIGAQEFFPLSELDTRTVGKRDFLKIAMATHNRSASDPKIESNRDESMREAYSTVPLKHRLLLRQIFDEDFKFFGYNPDHPSVFPPEDEFQLPYYRYFDIFDSFLYTDTD